MILLSIISTLLLGLSIYLFIPYWKHKTAIKRFHSHYLKEENKPAMEVVYTSKTGHNFSRIKDIMQYPAARLAAAEAYSRWAELCMMPEYFAKKLMELEMFAGSEGRVRQIASDLKQKSTMAAERATLQFLAHCLYLLDGENPLNPTAEFFEKKLEIWKQDPECEGFFLHSALRHIRDLKNMSQSGLVAYLMEQESKEVLTKINLSPITS